jgi:carbon-monoxide dehydrogenase small subunit
VITVEGLASNGDLSQLQKSYAEKWGLQCGFCTPGMLMSSYALLQSNSEPTQEEIRRALAGNLCRCTGYSPIIDSVQHAAQLMQEVDDD